MREAKSSSASLWILMIPLMLVLFISSLDQTIVTTALPNIVHSLGNPQDVAWITTAYLITSSITTLLLGKMGDLFGRKAILQFSLIVFLIGSLLCGIASSVFMLSLFRALQGIGGGGLTALVMAVIGDLVPPRERSRYQGLTGIVPAVALIAGPFLGGYISDNFSWRWVFYINLPVGVIAFALIATRLRLPRGKTVRSLDWLGGILVTITTTALLLVLNWGGGSYAWDSALILTLSGAAIVGLVLFVLVEHRAREPITPLSFFKSSIFTISSLQFFIATVSLFVVMVFVPMYLQNIRMYSGAQAGSFIIPMMIGIILTSSISGVRIAKTGRYKYWPVAGSILMGIAMWMLGTISPSTSSLWIIAAMLIVGMGQGALIQVALLAGQNAVPYTHIGTATGALNFFKGLGGAFGASIFAGVLTRQLGNKTDPLQISHAYGHTFLWVIPFIVVSLLIGILMREKPLSADMEKVMAGEVEVPEY
ncbi:MDR family MFS transporter [Cohnella sp. 56]|uniref:MDR family MFS transporter n=1 Tax=Cohnella sp. 56 TaxID=3113722 RepID=UPI0030E8EDB3